MKSSERISFYTHLGGAVAAAVGAIILLFQAREQFSYRLLALIYGVSVTFLFTASSLYHYHKKEEGESSFWRKLDHFAIFVMIAGTYTPVVWAYLSGGLKWGILIFQWSLVLTGFFFKFFYLKAPRLLYTAIYLLMGWSAIFTIRPLMMAMNLSSIVMLFAGGVSFTIGAIFYALKKPVITPGFGFHEIFHIFILAGGVFHYFLVFLAIR
ncbi:PAQR family membrane homeostasis protein TrhA [Tindallia californiensis]|uniref:Hemolysin III n=1 Tax=Tindallia californiensis TaxID=159292 RepID=A0A1H3MM63_9FIRM|nr:hemolysin III family protein [Tindallia californiensis]SDY77498.1 hemolysin III [Tindallia californiensis]